MNIFGKTTHKDTHTHNELKQLKFEVSKLTKTVNELTQQLLKTYSESNFLKPSSSLDREPTRLRSNSLGNRTFNVIEQELPNDSILTDPNYLPLSFYDADFEPVEDNVATVKDDKKTFYVGYSEEIPKSSPLQTMLSNPIIRSSSSISSTSSEDDIIGIHKLSENSTEDLDADSTARKIGRFIGGFFFGLGSVISGAFTGMGTGLHSIYTRATRAPELGENEFSDTVASYLKEFELAQSFFAKDELNQNLKNLETLSSCLEAMKTAITEDIDYLKTQPQTALIRKQVKNLTNLQSSLETFEKEVQDWTVIIDLSLYLDEGKNLLNELYERFANLEISSEEATYQITIFLDRIDKIENKKTNKKALKDELVARQLKALKSDVLTLQDLLKASLSSKIHKAQEDHLAKLKVFDDQFKTVLDQTKTVFSARNIREMYRETEQHLDHTKTLKNQAQAIDPDHDIIKEDIPTNLKYRKEAAGFEHKTNKLRLHERINLYTAVDAQVEALSELERTGTTASALYSYFFPNEALVENKNNLKEIKSLAGRIKKVEDAKFAELNTYSQYVVKTLTRAGNFICSFFMSYESQLAVADKQLITAKRKADLFYEKNMEEIKRAERHRDDYKSLINQAGWVGADSYSNNAVLRTHQRLKAEEKRLQQEVNRLEVLVEEKEDKEALESEPVYTPLTQERIWGNINSRIERNLLAEYGINSPLPIEGSEFDPEVYKNIDFSSMSVHKTPFDEFPDFNDSHIAPPPPKNPEPLEHPVLMGSNENPWDWRNRVNTPSQLVRSSLSSIDELNDDPTRTGGLESLLKLRPVTPSISHAYRFNPNIPPAWMVGYDDSHLVLVSEEGPNLHDNSSQYDDLSSVSSDNG